MTIMITTKFFILLFKNKKPSQLEGFEYLLYKQLPLKF
ncbi:hypothetical protein GS03_02672 [Flavobacterium sangjuense]|uniref:Uncharacterized protein n=1 Tax=Flavobacterium sangjuense TaxID=2518177 RepID=A0A4P7PX96_9FLAO|nr:hypothetical protein GS03_02672 [Flavobacterium sangjuense]